MALGAACAVMLTSCHSFALPFLESELPESRADEMATELVEYVNGCGAPDEYALNIRTMLPGDFLNEEVIEAVKYNGEGFCFSERADGLYNEVWDEGAQPEWTVCYYVDGVYHEKRTTYEVAGDVLLEKDHVEDEKVISWESLGRDGDAQYLWETAVALLNDDCARWATVSEIHARTDDPDLNYLVEIEFEPDAALEDLFPDEHIENLEIRAMTNKDATEFDSIILAFSSGFEEGAESTGYDPYQVSILFCANFAADYELLMVRIEEDGVHGMSPLA